MEINYRSTHPTFFSQTLESLSLAREILAAKDFDMLRKQLYGTSRTLQLFVKQSQRPFKKIFINFINFLIFFSPTFQAACCIPTTSQHPRRQNNKLHSMLKAGELLLHKERVMILFFPLASTLSISQE